MIDPMSRNRERARTDRHNATALLILGFSPACVGGDDRQECFEAQWQELIERFEHMASLQPVSAQPGAFLELRLSLTPGEGSQAGLVMVDEQLKRWVALGGSVAVDSL